MRPGVDPRVDREQGLEPAAELILRRLTRPNTPSSAGRGRMARYSKRNSTRVMGNLDHRNMTAREFVLWEAEQDERYEFVDGEVDALTGGTYAHDRTRTNLSAALLSHLRGTPCRGMGPEVRLRVDADTSGYYPDLFVVCRSIDPKVAELTEAKLIIEILSPSTEKKDRGTKWGDYQELTQIKEYVLIDPDKLRIEIYRRIDANDWRLHICSAQEILRFESIEFNTQFPVVFEDVF